jgi:hypothetical protein
MTQAGILQRCHWDEQDWATITVDSVLFGQPVTVCFMPAYNAGRVITAEMVAVLHDFLALTPAELPAIKQLLWDDCLRDFAKTDYGVDVEPGETDVQANQREFGIHHAEDAYAQCQVKQFSIPQPGPRTSYRLGTIDFEAEWAERDCRVLLQDGRLIPSLRS